METKEVELTKEDLARVKENLNSIKFEFDCLSHDLLVLEDKIARDLFNRSAEAQLKQLKKEKERYESNISVLEKQLKEKKVKVAKEVI